MILKIHKIHKICNPDKSGRKERGFIRFVRYDLISFRTIYKSRNINVALRKTSQHKCCITEKLLI